MGMVKPPKLPKEALKHLSSFYEERIDIHDKLRSCEDRGNAILKAVLKDLKGRVVLDLGCGSGHLTIPFSRKAKLVYALDNCRPMLRGLRRRIRSGKIRNIRVLESGYGRMPLPRESVDVVFSCWSFPAHSKNWERDFKEARRVLKRDGKIILVDTYSGGEFYRIKKKVQDPEFFSVIKKFRSGLHKWLLSKGFRYKVLNIVNEFGSKRNVEKLCAPFFGYEMATYLLARDRTGFRMQVSVFYWQK